MKKFIVNLQETLITFFTFIIRTAFLAGGIVLIYTGFSGVNQSSMHQLHGAVEQITFAIIMVATVMIGIFVIIYSIIKKRDEFLFFAF